MVCVSLIMQSGIVNIKANDDKPKVFTTTTTNKHHQSLVQGAATPGRTRKAVLTSRALHWWGSTGKRYRSRAKTRRSQRSHEEENAGTRGWTRKAVWSRARLGSTGRRDHTRANAWRSGGSQQEHGEGNRAGTRGRLAQSSVKVDGQTIHARLKANEGENSNPVCVVGHLEHSSV